MDKRISFANTHSPLDIGPVTCFCTRRTKTKRAREKGSSLAHQDHMEKMATYVIVCTDNNTRKIILENG